MLVKICIVLLACRLGAATFYRHGNRTTGWPSSCAATCNMKAIGCLLLNSPAACGLSDCELSMRNNLRVVGISVTKSACGLC